MQTAFLDQSLILPYIVLASASFVYLLFSGSILKNLKKVYLRENESDGGRGRGERKRESSVDTGLGSEPDTGLHLTTLRS